MISELLFSGVVGALGFTLVPYVINLVFPRDSQTTRWYIPDIIYTLNANDGGGSLFIGFTFGVIQFILANIFGYFMGNRRIIAV